MPWVVAAAGVAAAGSIAAGSMASDAQEKLASGDVAIEALERIRVVAGSEDHLGELAEDRLGLGDHRRVRLHDLGRMTAFGVAQWR